MNSARMSIISKETWEKFTQEEKEEIRKMYSDLISKLKGQEVGSDDHIALSLAQHQYTSLFGKENLQPKSLTYEDVARELFEGKDYYYPTDIYRNDTEASLSSPSAWTLENDYKDWMNCTSENQALKLRAINKLLNVAKFLNGDWKPDWDIENKQADSRKWYFFIDEEDSLQWSWVSECNYVIVYFRTEALAKQAVEILGEEAIRLALSTDW